MGPAIAAGLFAFAVVATLVGNVCHNGGAGFAPGIAAGLWASWPLLHNMRVQRYNFLHPVPREYKIPLPQAFAQIRDLLAELSYNFGDKWHIVTADPKTKRIVANLRFVDKSTKLDMDARGGIHTREERLQRFLELEVQLKDTDHDSTVVKLDFHPKLEGVDQFACDSVVGDFCHAVEKSLGGGTEAGSALDTKLGAPPWWLLGVTVCCLLVMKSDVDKHVSTVMKGVSQHPDQLVRQREWQDSVRKQQDEEMGAWNKFKEANRIQ